MLLDPMEAPNSLELLATIVQSLDIWLVIVKTLNALVTCVVSQVTLAETAPMKLEEDLAGLVSPVITAPSQDIWRETALRVIGCATYARSLDISAVNALRAEWTLAVLVVLSALCVARLDTSLTSALILPRILETRSAIHVVKVAICQRIVAKRKGEMEKAASSAMELGTSRGSAPSASPAASLDIWRATAKRLHKRSLILASYIN